MKKSGLPYFIHLPNEVEVIREYHKNLDNSILLKDVVDRFKVRNVAFLETLTHFLALNVGSLVSAKKISDYLKSQRMNMSTQLVLDYLNYLETAQFIFCVKPMDIKGKRVFEIGEKYYFEDIGIRNSFVGYSIQDTHKLLENSVLHHLKISGYSVFTGNDDTKEIDFVAEKNGERLYIQVTYLFQDEQTIEHEFGNLLAIPDNYPKYVVTMDT